MGRNEELLATGRLVGEALGGTVDIVRGVHKAILRRVDDHLPAVAAPVTAVHEAIADTVYSSVATAHRVVPSVGMEVLARTGDQRAPALSNTRVGRALLPAVNGLWGDRVADRHDALAVPMAVRSDDGDVVLDRDVVRAAFPEATRRIVVFLHGWCESEQSWWLFGGGWGRADLGRGADGLATSAGDEPADTTSSYGDRLQDDLGVTPVYLRFNTGLRVSDNGIAMAHLMHELAAAWPTPVEEISLVGHSMGGLVARSACHYGDVAGYSWAGAVRTVVTLGTPHLGSPIEKGAHVADRLLSVFPETRPLAVPLRVRSVGTKDLRYGAVLEEDWIGHDPDEFLRDRCVEAPFLTHATYVFGAGSVTRDPDHPAGRLFGDGIVHQRSAAGVGRTRRISFSSGARPRMGGIGHFSILNHPDVYRELRGWIGS